MLFRSIPIRYGRMIPSPFVFFRGAAAIMAADLAHTPTTGVRVQSCGDAHLMNFGAFATPERRLIFDINDFDETLPAPWEWDVKRLATCFLIASRSSGFSEADARKTALRCVRSYRERMAEFAQMRTLEVWYARGGKRGHVLRRHADDGRPGRPAVPPRAATSTSGNCMT